jgi:hypothetical protein
MSHFLRDSQVGVPKLRFLLFQNFGPSYLSQIKYVLGVEGQYLIAFENIFPTVYNTPIRPHLTLFFKGFVVKSQIPTLTPALFLLS